MRLVAVGALGGVVGGVAYALLTLAWDPDLEVSLRYLPSGLFYGVTIGLTIGVVTGGAAALAAMLARRLRMPVPPFVAIAAFVVAGCCAVILFTGIASDHNIAFAAAATATASAGLAATAALRSRTDASGR